MHITLRIVAGLVLTMTGILQAQPAARLNSLGFPPEASKTAVFLNTTGDQVEVLGSDNSVVLTAPLTPASVWGPSGESARRADLSAVRTPGTYRLRVDGQILTEELIVQPDAWSSLVRASLRYFYFNRASIDLTQEHAGVWARPAGHVESRAEVHTDAQTGTETREVVAPKGWYDAGDYGRYIVNSGITM